MTQSVKQKSICMHNIVPYQQHTSMHLYSKRYMYVAMETGTSQDFHNETHYYYMYMYILSASRSTTDRINLHSFSFLKVVSIPFSHESGYHPANTNEVIIHIHSWRALFG